MDMMVQSGGKKKENRALICLKECQLDNMGRLQSRLPSSLHFEMGEFADLSGSLPHVPSRMAV
ncbi:hypothetical protein R6Q57_004279 [Mikania cordata]